MKTLKNYQILFDAECPMCDLYTKAFVSSGILDKHGRTAYQELNPAACPMVDRQRAVNEIALVDQTTGEVTYGIRTLFKLFGEMMPVFKPLFSFGPFIWIMSKVYAFIAYNRRVIVPPFKKDDGSQLQPTFKLNYRIAYLLFTWAMTGLILSHYVHLMKDLLPQGNSYREYSICGGQILFQGIIVVFMDRSKLWSYLGNMMTISFAGALLLIIGLVLSHWLSLPPIVYVAYFLLVAGGMLLEHVRRVKLLELSWVLSATWVLYRLIVLLIILLT